MLDTIKQLNDIQTFSVQVQRPKVQRPTSKSLFKNPAFTTSFAKFLTWIRALLWLKKYFHTEKSCLGNNNSVRR
jgi:hypothetical protein